MYEQWPLAVLHDDPGRARAGQRGALQRAAAVGRLTAGRRGMAALLFAAGRKRRPRPHLPPPHMVPCLACMRIGAESGARACWSGVQLTVIGMGLNRRALALCCTASNMPSERAVACRGSGRRLCDSCRPCMEYQTSQAVGLVALVGWPVLGNTRGNARIHIPPQCSQRGHGPHLREAGHQRDAAPARQAAWL